MPNQGYLSKNTPLPGIDDEEGDRLPPHIPRVVDAHVHIFPGAVFNAVWNWFDRYGWPVRYRQKSSDLLAFLFDHGIDHVVALQYAHKPGIASFLNDYMVKKTAEFPGRITGLATVFPGEKNADDILESAFARKLKGVKLHSHVQCFDLSGPEMDPILACCRNAGLPLVIHAGREPKSPAYACDPYLICSADRVEAVLKRYPDLLLVVPHLGMDEFTAYERLVLEYDNLWLDTAMAVTDYLPVKTPVELIKARPDRILYGSDFPNIPYAWDRELKWFERSGLPCSDLDRILWHNAAELFKIPVGDW